MPSPGAETGFIVSLVVEHSVVDILGLERKPKTTRPNCNLLILFDHHLVGRRFTSFQELKLSALEISSLDV
jgi:hypothetical protein